MKRPRWLGGRERGFTLIELLVAIPIAGLVAAAAAGTIVQLLNSNDISADMLAVRQVQTAGDWVSHDGVQVQSTDNIGVGSGMPFTLKWSYWDTGVAPPVNETHEVTYSYSLVAMPSGLKRLERHEVVKDALGTVMANTTMTVAEYIDGSATTCLWEAGSSTTFIFKVTAVVGGKTETRVYQMRPRALA